jgi:phosphate transport system protein
MASGAGRQHFQQQLREIEAAALGGMDMALGQIDRVLDALDPVDARLAEFVIADDDRIDGRYLEVHQGVLSLLALQAPVAGDLRLAAAVLHVISNIERIGDQCVNVAKLIPVSSTESPARDTIIERILRMGGLARGELAQACLAFAERDVALAESLVAQDQEVNRLNREVFRLAVQAGEDPDLREWAMTTTLVARAFERIGDNAVAIGEQAIFVVTGQFRELASLLHPAGGG